jgi:diguanylate cyclase (GGDEF)-like protein
MLKNRPRAACRFRTLLLGAVALGALGSAPSSSAAQDIDSLEAALTDLTGSERAGVLTELTVALRSRAPSRALEYGHEAEALFDRFPDPASRVRALNEMAWAYMEIGQYDTASAYGQRSRSLAEERGNLEGLARALNNLGVIQRRISGFSAAIDFFGRSLEIQRLRGDLRNSATSLNNIGVVYGFDLGVHDRAVEYMLEVLSIREEMEDETGIAQSHNNLGVIYTNLADDEQAIRHLETALQMWTDLDIPPRLASTLTNLAWVYRDPESPFVDYERALAYETRSLAIRESIGSDVSVAISLASIGDIHTLTGRLELAGEVLGRAASLQEEAGEQRTLAQTLLSLAHLNRLRGDPDQAEAHALRALGIAQTISATVEVGEAYAELSDVYEATGDLQSALDFMRLAEDTEEEVFSEASARRVEVLRNERDAVEAQLEIQRLAGENTLQKARAERLGSLAGVGTLAILILFLLYRRQIQSARLAREKEQRKNLEVVVDERTAALVEANAHLEDLSLTDTLTGLRNRRFLGQTLEEHLAFSLRAHHEGGGGNGASPESADVVFFLIDLDNFKSVNDLYGHATGDMVLSQTAQVLAGTCRASDTLIRWGGEEFLVVSRQADRRQARSFAERMCQALRGHGFVTQEGIELRKTCSIGFAPFPFVPSSPDAITWEQTLKLADLALYEAKRRGRDGWIGVMDTDATDVASLAIDSESLADVAGDDVVSVESSFRE